MTNSTKNIVQCYNTGIRKKTITGQCRKMARKKQNNDRIKQSNNRTRQEQYQNKPEQYQDNAE